MRFESQEIFVIRRTAPGMDIDELQLGVSELPSDVGGEPDQ